MAAFERGHSPRARSTLVVAQLAISLVLLAGAGLSLRSLYRLETVEAGYETERVLTLHLDSRLASLSGRKLHSRLSLAASCEAPRDPGSGGRGARPLGPAQRARRSRSGKNLFRRGQPVVPRCPRGKPGYFRAIGVPILEGRAFSSTDSAGSAPVAILNEAASSMLRASRELVWGGRRHAIVGVVGDVRQYGLEREAEPSVYFPLGQVPLRVTELVVRTEANPHELSEAIEKAVHEIDAAQAVAYVSTLEEARLQSVAAPRLLASLLSIFAALALAVTAVGLGGALALQVERRAREFGIRLALGAKPRDVSRLVLRQSLGFLFAGLALGLPAAFALAGLLSGLLFETEPHDPFTFAGVSIVLLLVAGSVSLVPARKAFALDPLSTIRLDEEG